MYCSKQAGILAVTLPLAASLLLAGLLLRP
jgi:hypothetical protein